MSRNLSRNRRLAVICGGSASAIASCSTVLFSRANSGLSDLEHGIGVGLCLGTALSLIGLSLVFLKRDRSGCLSSRNTGD